MFPKLDFTALYKKLVEACTKFHLALIDKLAKTANLNASLVESMAVQLGKCGNDIFHNGLCETQFENL